MFKRGDFIRIKPNRKLESGEKINDWAGEIQEVYRKEKTCLINLDAQTINSLTDSFLIDGINIGAEPFEYVFNFDDLELSDRRDTDQQLEKALDDLASRVLDLENSLDEIYRSQQDQWIEEFQKNEIFKILNKTQQENSEFVLSTFMEYMFNYEGVMPGQWTTSNVEEVCLRIVPRKIVADEETFEVYGDVLACFFNFIGEQKYINNAQRLINKVQKIKTKILDNSKDPRFYGMTKSLMFGRGGSLSNDSEVLNMDNVIKNLESLSPNEKVPKTKKIAQRPLTPNPFKGIGRNEKITVKYTDGRIIEDVKFKKVEMDLKNGKCEMEK